MMSNLQFYLLKFTWIYQSVKQKPFREFTMSLSFYILAYKCYIEFKQIIFFQKY